MKNISILLITLMVLFNGCKQEKTQEKVPVIDSHTSQNSVDWAGTYSGMLPCADCNGIETTLELTSDNEFILRQRYEGKSDEVFEEKGMFEWNESGSEISLSIEDEEPKFHQYKVGENKLFKLDSEGNRIEGELSEFYILTKE
ncbi:MAG: copper resistance protein NlpE N-terminal domain-containing protein [Balneola sp.]